MTHALALIVYAVLTIAYTWPLVVALGDLVPHDVGDPLLSTWTLWWNATVTPFTARWWDGLAFYPARNTLTFSDHRVGIGVIASPVIWLGGSPLSAHNLAFLLSFFLSAAAAYALCFTLTRSRAASFVGGLVFGFNPYRADHLPHLELLSSYWLPPVLLALHRWAATLGRGWLVLVAVSLFMQALTCGYYFAFSSVLLGLWLLWFTPRGLPLGEYARLGAALVAPLVAIAPVLWRYREAHEAMGLSRTLLEIEHYSADIIGLFTAPRMLALWTAPDAWQRPEGALMPGFVAVALVAGGLWVGRHTNPTPVRNLWVQRIRTAVLVCAAIMAVVALIPELYGPVAYELGAIRISVSDSYKPLSTATVLFVCWVLTSARARQAWRERSPFAFYVLATIALWLFALGPTGRLLGERVLYKAPYSWLMVLPGFKDGFRVPARFAMLAVLTLSVAAAFGLWRLMQGRSARERLAAACVAGAAVAAESWIEPLPTFPPPPPLVIPAAVPEDAVVLELPFGIAEDATAIYRSIEHRRRTINGMSGYDAPHYAILRAALDEGRIDVLKEFAFLANVAIFVPRSPTGAQLLPLLTTRAGAKTLGTTQTHEVLLLEHVPKPEILAATGRRHSPVRPLLADSNAQDVARLADGDYRTAWMGAGPQRGKEQFTADLGEVASVSAISLAQGRIEFPRAIAIDLSIDNVSWVEVWKGDTTGRSLSAAMENPRAITLHLAFAPQAARYVRIRQVGQSPVPWAVAEFEVFGKQ